MRDSPSCKSRFFAGCVLLWVGVAQGQAPSVSVTDAWVRGTVAAQTASGAFMEITSREAARLVGASSAAAGRVELHEMRMEGNTMKMRALERLELPAGKPVTLGPGGYHLMLLDLKHALQAGTTVPLTLEIESAGGKRSKLEVGAKVRAIGAAKH
jgi:copper(I)-binding protein